MIHTSTMRELPPVCSRGTSQSVLTASGIDTWGLVGNHLPGPAGGPQNQNRSACRLAPPGRLGGLEPLAQKLRA